jgi:regulatory protein YycH of two-component signal transduction system YycFG
MGMKYETIKSGILIILVLLSVLLTWNLWTYQPNYATMEKNSYVAEVNMSEKQDVKKIVGPDMVMYHKQGGHFGTTRTDELDKLMKELSRWSFYDVKVFTDKPGNINELTQGNGKVEIIFPAEVPIDLYRNVLKFTDKKLPSFNFYRIIINAEGLDKGNGIVYFVSTANQLVYTSHISASFLNDFNRTFYKGASRYPSYFSYNVTEKRTIYLPDKPVEMMVYKYLPVTLNSEQFKEALFTDPSFVQKSIIAKGEEYTNGSSKLNINYDKNMLLYVNPTAEGYYLEDSNGLIKRSIDFVNDHGGWIDSYRYVEKDDNYHRVTFRLYSEEGYPVFNEDGLSEISETWGKNEINKYVRSDISLELPLKMETQKVIQPSGHNVIKFIQSKKNFRPELLENLVLGYEMERDSSESKLILLQPVWFYQYDKKWQQIPMEELGGMNNGLE